MMVCFVVYVGLALCSLCCGLDRTGQNDDLAYYLFVSNKPMKVKDGNVVRYSVSGKRDLSKPSTLFVSGVPIRNVSGEGFFSPIAQYLNSKNTMVFKGKALEDYPMHVYVVRCSNNFIGRKSLPGKVIAYKKMNIANSKLDFDIKDIDVKVDFEKLGKQSSKVKQKLTGLSKLLETKDFPKIKNELTDGLEHLSRSIKLPKKQLQLEMAHFEKRLNGLPKHNPHYEKFQTIFGENGVLVIPTAEDKKRNQSFLRISRIVLVKKKGKLIVWEFR